MRALEGETLALRTMAAESTGLASVVGVGGSDITGRSVFEHNGSDMAWRRSVDRMSCFRSASSHDIQSTIEIYKLVKLLVDLIMSQSRGEIVSLVKLVGVWIIPLEWRYLVL